MENEQIPPVVCVHYNIIRIQYVLTPPKIKTKTFLIYNTYLLQTFYACMVKYMVNNCFVVVLWPYVICNICYNFYAYGGGNSALNRIFTRNAMYFL